MLAPPAPCGGPGGLEAVVMSLLKSSVSCPLLPRPTWLRLPGKGEEEGGADTEGGEVGCMGGDGRSGWVWGKEVGGYGNHLAQAP